MAYGTLAQELIERSYHERPVVQSTKRRQYCDPSQRAGAPGRDVQRGRLMANVSAPGMSARVVIARVSAKAWSRCGDAHVAAITEIAGLLRARRARAQAQGRIAGILLDNGEPDASLQLGGYDIIARDAQALIGRMLLDAGLETPAPPPPLPSETEPGASTARSGDARPFGLIIHESDDTFLVAGRGLTLDFAPTRRGRGGRPRRRRPIDKGQWAPGRALNGDERLFTLPLGQISAVRVRLLSRPH
jgi:hypothetical protein